MRIQSSVQIERVIWSSWLYLLAALTVVAVVVLLQDDGILLLVVPIPTCYAYRSTEHFTSFRRTPPSTHQQKKMMCRLYVSNKGQQQQDFDEISSSSSSSSLTKLESKTIGRFTTGYNKLCKTCPTRLQPRVDTIVEMILGLSEEERHELLTTVDRRLQQGNLSTISSSQDVYNFQIGGVISNKKEQPQLEEEEETTSRPINIVVEQDENEEDEDDDKEEEDSLPSTTTTKDDGLKLLRNKKLEKTKKKYEYSKEGIAKTKHLLEATTALLSSSYSSATFDLDESYYDTNYYHEIDAFKQMTRDELKMQHLKLQAQKAKYEQQVAKLRMKRYKAASIIK